MAEGTEGHWEHERELVLSEYATWRVIADDDAPVGMEVRTLETLLRLKAEQQGSPEPGWWTPELTAELLTEVVPRMVVQPRERVMDLVPTLSRFFSCLAETGRWERGAMPITEATAMVEALEFATLEAADDPSRRSFSTNVLGHGMSLGVDLEDDDQLAGYMHWYESLPDAERVRLGATGRLVDPSSPFELEASMRAAAAEAPPSADWPWFLPDPEEAGSISLETLAPDDEGTAHAENAFVRRAAALLELIGEKGRPITATGALGRADCRALLVEESRESSAQGTGVRSMWERPELAGPWVTLLDGGWLEIVGSRVRRLPGPVPFIPFETDADGFVEFAHAVLTAHLLGRDARGEEDGGFHGMPDTLAALLAACRPSGLSLPDPESAETALPSVPIDPATGGWDQQEKGRLAAVRRDLGELVESGILTREGQNTVGSAAVMIALVALIRERDDGSGPQR